MSTTPGESAAWYTASAVEGETFPRLTFDLDVEVCVVGGGIAGLTIALEAAKLGHTSGIGADWPQPYLAGKEQLERNLERERAMAAQNAGLSPLEQANLAQGV